jgi:hypothetical protein
MRSIFHDGGGRGAAYGDGRRNTPYIRCDFSVGYPLIFRRNLNFPQQKWSSPRGEIHRDKSFLGLPDSDDTNLDCGLHSYDSVMTSGLMAIL